MSILATRTVASRSALALAVVCCLLCPQSSRAQNTFLPGVYSTQSVNQDVVPFEVQNGLIVVKALLGEGLIENAVINTGLPICLVTPDFAVKRTMKASGTRDVAIMDRNVPALNIPVQSIRINRMLVTGAASGILDLYKQLSSSPPADAPQVWIGNSVLAALSVTIDPQLQQIMLRPPGAPLPVGAIIVPFELKQGRIWVDVKVNGKKNFPAIVDTGSVGTLLPASVAKALSLAPAATLPITHPDGKEGKACAVELTDIALAGLKVPDVQAVYVEPGVKDGFDPDLGIIGNDVLLRYRVTIDCVQKKIAFEKLNTPKAIGPGTAVSRTGQQGASPAGVQAPNPGLRRIQPAIGH
jgi:hypothetical protein